METVLVVSIVSMVICGFYTLALPAWDARAK